MWQDELKKAIAIKAIVSQTRRDNSTNLAAGNKLSPISVQAHLQILKQNEDAQKVKVSRRILLRERPNLPSHIAPELLRVGLSRGDHALIATGLMLGGELPDAELGRSFAHAVFNKDARRICLALLLGAQPHGHELEGISVLRWVDQRIEYRSISSLLRTWLQRQSRVPYTVQKSPANFAYPCDRTTDESEARRAYFAKIINGGKRR